MPENSLMLSVRELAEQLGISESLCRQAVRDNRIPSIRIGRRILVPKTFINRLICDDATCSQQMLAQQMKEGGRS